MSAAKTRVQLIKLLHNTVQTSRLHFTFKWARGNGRDSATAIAFYRDYYAYGTVEYNNNNHSSASSIAAARARIWSLQTRFPIARIRTADWVGDSRGFRWRKDRETDVRVHSSCIVRL